MAMISCPECGKRISEHAISCHECGYQINVASGAHVQFEESELSKLIGLARRARQSYDNKNAKRFYNQILEKYPDNWEAIFYTVYYDAIECKIMEISSAANSVANCIYNTFTYIEELDDEQEKIKAVNTVIDSSCSIASLFASNANSHYEQFSNTSNAYSECAERVFSAYMIYREIDSAFVAFFPNEKKRLVEFRKLYLDFIEQYSDFIASSDIIIDNLKSQIANDCPEYRHALELSNEIEALESEIYHLDALIENLVVERKPKSVGYGVLFAIYGTGALLFNIHTIIFSSFSFIGFLISVVLIGVSYLLLRKTPSQEIIDENLKKKHEYTAERDKLVEKLNTLL